LLSWCVNDLLRCVKRTESREFNVAVMPDFFIDRFVTYPGDTKQFSTAISKVAERKGGNIHGVKQMEIRGGNAANTAAALAVLNVKVFPIITTSQFGLHLLNFFLGRYGVGLSHVKADGEAALTIAFEVVYGEEMVNIMMGDLGSLQNFGQENLTQDDYDLLRQVDYACVFNWASTRRWGTELAEEVFRYVKERGRGKTYYDTGDPTPNKRNISRLVEKILKSDLVDILSVNENEAFQYASQLDNRLKRLKSKLNHHELARECARTLAKHISARVDLHTTTFAGSFTHENEIVVPTFSVSGLRTTGAGDSWNAGNIYGDALKIPDSCRITMANAVAAYYVSSPTAEHPTIPKLIEFCQKQLHI
jgi:sugar/nucleoside kinase (ribokinase family)